MFIPFIDYAAPPSIWMSLIDSHLSKSIILRLFYWPTSNRSLLILCRERDYEMSLIVLMIVMSKVLSSTFITFITYPRVLLMANMNGWSSIMSFTSFIGWECFIFEGSFIFIFSSLGVNKNPHNKCYSPNLTILVRNFP